MKIIKEGHYDGPETRPHKFECRRCGCVWKADPGEFEIADVFCDDRLVCRDFFYYCPVCNLKTFAFD